MRKWTPLLFLIVFQLTNAQNSNWTSAKTATYRYGHNGMELIVTSKKETIIISTFNSKLELKQDIAEKIYAYYKNNKENSSLTNKQNLTIDGNDAKVTGKCLVTKKGKLTAVEFYYEKIEWNSGLIELYKKDLS